MENFTAARYLTISKINALTPEWSGKSSNFNTTAGPARLVLAGLIFFCSGFQEKEIDRIVITVLIGHRNYRLFHKKPAKPMYEEDEEYFEVRYLKNLPFLYILVSIAFLFSNGYFVL